MIYGRSYDGYWYLVFPWATTPEDRVPEATVYCFNGYMNAVRLDYVL